MQNYCTHVQTHSIPTPLSSIFAHFWQNLQNTVHMDSPHFPIKCTGNLHQIWRNGKKVWKICAKLNLRLVYKYILWILSIRTAVQLAAWFFPSEPQYNGRLDSCTSEPQYSGRLGSCPSEPQYSGRLSEQASLNINIKNIFFSF